MNLEDHPLAAIFPLFDPPDLAALADDIEANGLRDPIWLLDGKILDGRNRYRACVSKDIDPRTEHYKGKDPLGFVLSKNLHRRHLNESQRAMVAANIAKWKLGDNQTTGSASLQTRSEAASLMNVSERSVASAAKVKEKGIPELQAAVVSGTASVSAAAAVADLPKKEQKAAVKSGVAKAAKKIKDAAPVLCDRCTKSGIPARDCRWCAEAAGEAATKKRAAADHPFTRLKTDTTLLSGAWTRALKEQDEAFKRLYQYCVWCGLVDHDPKKGGLPAFLPLRGMAKVLELAGQGGTMLAQSSVVMAYGIASGGFIPPVTARRRKKRPKT